MRRFIGFIPDRVEEPMNRVIRSSLRAGIAGLAMFAMTSMVTAQDSSINLTDAQKGAIYQTVQKEGVKSAAGEDLRLSVGAPVPPSVQLYKLPDEAMTDIPVMRAYQYAVFAEDVLIVDPNNRRVVDVIRKAETTK
jgi:hypothetical protein